MRLAKKPVFETTPVVSKLGLFLSRHFVCLSEEAVKAVGPLYLVSMPGEVNDPTQGNGKNSLIRGFADTFKKQRSIISKQILLNGWWLPNIKKKLLMCSYQRGLIPRIRTWQIIVNGI